MSGMTFVRRAEAAENRWMLEDAYKDGKVNMKLLEVVWKRGREDVERCNRHLNIFVVTCIVGIICVLTCFIYCTFKMMKG
jgi:hypothetical protein